MTTFSIIVPTYNRAHLIDKTIESILEQTYFHFELIIVDDGGTDNTDEVIQRYLKDSRVHYLRKENGERGAARNFGVKQSHGDYITFLDSDDILLPWHFQTAAKKIHEAQSPPAFHLAYEIIQSNGRVIGPTPLPSPVNETLIKGNFMSCMGVFLRRDIALENPFDETRQLSGSEDYELWMRVASRVPILSYSYVTSRLIQHDERSVMNMDMNKLLTRIDLLERKLESDTGFTEKFGNRLSEFYSYNALYLALHLALSGERMEALKKLKYAVRQNARVMSTYRFAVVIKKVLFR